MMGTRKEFFTEKVKEVFHMGLYLPSGLIRGRWFTLYG
jgi:hypothetical protein